ncbi:MAG: DNA starvation/stationary phase protection protein [Waddliaceae bacterium]
MDFSADIVEELVQELSQALANNYVLYVKTLNCHWNVEDPRFLFLHEMFQDQYEAIAKNGDDIAERIGQMGKRVDASLRTFLHDSKIHEIESALSANEMLRELYKDHKKIIIHLRQVIGKSDKYHDPGLTDLLSDILLFHEKTAWIINRHC